MQKSKQEIIRKVYTINNKEQGKEACKNSSNVLVNTYGRKVARNEARNYARKVVINQAGNQARKVAKDYERTYAKKLVSNKARKYARRVSKESNNKLEKSMQEKQQGTRH